MRPFIVPTKKTRNKDKGETQKENPVNLIKKHYT